MSSSALSRNRLGYDRGMTAIAGDPSFDAAWQEWILTVRHQIGLIDFADLIYVPQRAVSPRTRQGHAPSDSEQRRVAGLFGDKEGKIALANRGRIRCYCSPHCSGIWTTRWRRAAKARRRVASNDADR